MSRTPSRRQQVQIQTDRSNGLTRKDFDFCKKQFLKVLRKCPEQHFERLRILIPSITFSFRQLHKLEICEIWAALLGSSDQKIESWIFTECAELVNLDESGFCQFAHASFKSFFAVAPISGIDRSHQTLARATTMVQEAQMAGNGTNGLSQYASEHWKAHYIQVQDFNAGLTARVHRMLVPEACDVPSDQYSCSSVKSAYEICQRDGFSTLGKLYGVMLSSRHAREGDITQCVPACSRREELRSSDMLAQDLQKMTVKTELEPGWVLVGQEFQSTRNDSRLA